MIHIIIFPPFTNLVRQPEYLFTLDRHIICGDFNAHSPLWGHYSTQRRTEGEILEGFLVKYDFTCLNDGSPKFVGPKGVLTPLDLTFVSSNISHNFSWNVHDDTLSSDHYPVFTKLGGQDVPQEPPPPEIKKWNSEKAI